MTLPANLTQHNILGLILKGIHVVESSTDKKVLQGSQTNITYFEFEFRDEIYLPVIAEGDPAPPQLLNVTQRQSTEQEVLCVSCTLFCDCYGEQDSLNPFTATREIAKSAEEETETDNIDSNRPGDSDDGLEHIFENPISDYYILFCFVL